LRGEKAAGCVGVWQHSTRAREDETRETPKSGAHRDGISARFWAVPNTFSATVFDRVSNFVLTRHDQREQRAIQSRFQGFLR